MSYQILPPDGPFDYSEHILELLTNMTSWHTNDIPNFDDEDALLWELKQAPLSELIVGLPTPTDVVVDYLYHPKMHYVLIPRENDSPLLIAQELMAEFEYIECHYEISAVRDNVGYDVEPHYTDVLTAGTILMLLHSTKLSNDVKAMLVEGFNRAIRPDAHCLMWSNHNQVALSAIFDAHNVEDYCFGDNPFKNNINDEGL